MLPCGLQPDMVRSSRILYLPAIFGFPDLTLINQEPVWLYEPGCLCHRCGDKKLDRTNEVACLAPSPENYPHNTSMFALQL